MGHVMVVRWCMYRNQNLRWCEPSLNQDMLVWTCSIVTHRLAPSAGHCSAKMLRSLLSMVYDPAQTPVAVYIRIM